tara:strand:- start:21249 stop:21722 length:474 start_codon:yes stop_codon:yes gene_type:complete
MPTQPLHAFKLIFKPTFIALLASLLFPLLCQAEVYKWTDSNGDTHYSDIKPNKVSSEKLNIKTNNPTQERASPQSSARALDEKKSKELEAQAKRLKSETEKRELSSQCENTQNNLKILQENSRIKINENGDTRYLTPEEIEQKKQSYIKLINEQCSK